MRKYFINIILLLLGVSNFLFAQNTDKDLALYRAVQFFQRIFESSPEVIRVSVIGGVSDTTNTDKDSTLYREVQFFQRIYEKTPEAIRVKIIGGSVDSAGCSDTSQFSFTSRYIIDENGDTVGQGSGGVFGATEIFATRTNSDTFSSTSGNIYMIKPIYVSDAIRADTGIFAHALSVGIDPPSVAADFNGIVEITRFLRHNNNETTYLEFPDVNNWIRLVAGNNNYVDMNTTQLKLNALGRDVDISLFTGDVLETMYLDGGTDRVGIRTTNANSTLDVNGSIEAAYTISGTNYTALQSDQTIEMTNAGDTLFLPAGSGNKEFYIINASAGNIVIDADGAETIGNTSPTATITVATGVPRGLVWNGTVWRVKI
jgi:hypothetical protein